MQRLALRYFPIDPNGGFDSFAWSFSTLKYATQRVNLVLLNENCQIAGAFWADETGVDLGARRNMLRALIVEDNPHFREIFKMAFHHKIPSVIVEEAGNGEEALQIISGMSPDLIFLDFLLPVEDGLQLARKIKKGFPNIRIAMLTNYDLPANRRTASKFGVDRFFIKDSLNWEEIKDWVVSILDNPRKKF